MNSFRKYIIVGNIPFKAKEWIGGVERGSTLNSMRDASSVHLTDHCLQAKLSTRFLPSEFLVPHWNGAGLISKEALKIRNNLFLLVDLAKNNFKEFAKANLSLRKQIHIEFIKGHKGEKIEDLDDLEFFWTQITNKNSPYLSILSTFIDTYCFQSVVLYLLKVRFIAHLCQATNTKLRSRFLFNPGAFINRIFIKGSSFDFQSPALQTNQYSWFCPLYNFEYKKIIKESAQGMLNLSVTELTKILTYSSERNKIKLKDEDFAHCMSHQSFGHFLNILLVHFPIWSQQKGEGFLLDQNHSMPRPLSCKMIGEHLSSLALGHILDQHDKIKQRWSRIITPELITGDDGRHDYQKLFHEFLMLTTLCQIAQAHEEYNPIHLISSIMRNKNSRGKEPGLTEQFCMFSMLEEETNAPKTYSRIVLNLISMPKKNPFHYLFSQMMDQLNSLNSEGFLYVFTPQNLFVPSQSDKLSNLLESFKLEGVFNFEGLKGKGKIPPYLYILSKRQHHFKMGQRMSHSLERPNEGFSTFTFYGELKMFSQFHLFTNELSLFLTDKNSINTPLFQKEFDDSLQLTYHKDAIVDGKVVNSMSSDLSQITHPVFFKKLTQSSLAFGKYFFIELLNNEESFDENFHSGFLGIKIDYEKKYPLVAIVNAQDPSNISLEIIKSEAYHGYKENYGTAYYTYLGLRPKTSSIHLNALREFLASHMAKHIIQLTFNTNTKIKHKAALDSLMVPTFLFDTHALPLEKGMFLNVFYITSEEILKKHPGHLSEEIKTSFEQLQLIGSSYPAQTLDALNIFKNTLEKTLNKLESDKNNYYFSNPLVINALMNKENRLKPLYPNNNDVYLEVLAHKDLHSALTSTQFEKKDAMAHLILLSGPSAVVRLTSTMELAKFIEFILSKANGHSISDVITHFKIPDAITLINSINQLTQLKDLCQTSLEYSDKLVQGILQKAY